MFYTSGRFSVGQQLAQGQLKKIVCILGFCLEVDGWNYLSSILHFFSVQLPKQSSSLDVTPSPLTFHLSSFHSSAFQLAPPCRSLAMYLCLRTPSSPAGRALHIPKNTPKVSDQLKRCFDI